MMFYIFVLLMVCCDGFLLEGKTQPPATSSPLMSDKHFYMLMDLLTEERQYRRQLEQDVTKLKQDLLTTEKAVTDRYQMWTKYNGTVEKQILNLSNSTSNLQSELVLLQTKYDKLQQDHTDLKRNHSILEAHSTKIEQKLSMIEQIKYFSNIQNVINVINDTKHLETEIQKTNSRLDGVVNEADARKQDFVALFNKVLSTDTRLKNISLSHYELSSKEMKMENMTLQIQQELNDVRNRVNGNDASTNEKFNNMTMSFNNRLNELSVREMKMENMTLQIQQELNDIRNRVNGNDASTNEKFNNITMSFNNRLNELSGRVAMTACSNTSPQLNNDSVIPFQTIRQSYGIQDKLAFTRTGILTIEQEGLYLLMVNLVEHGNAGHSFNIDLNGSGIRNCYATEYINWEESSCTTVIQLNVHDKISVKTGSSLHISDLYTCMTIVKIM